VHAMLGDARTRRSAQFGIAALLACGLSAACGHDGTSPQTPSATQLPADAGLLHVIRDGGIANYRIDGRTGSLTPVGSTSLQPVQAIAVDPSGRFLHAGVASDRSGVGGRIASFSIDRRSGALLLVAETPGPDCMSMTWWASSPKCEWSWLQAGDSRLVAMWRHKTYHDTYSRYVSYAVRDSGLSDLVGTELSEYDGDATADTGPRMLYAAEERTGDLVGYAVLGDGRLDRVASSHLCGTSTFPYGSPLLAAGGFLFSEATVGGTKMLCSHRGDSLESRDALASSATAAAYLPSIDGQSALLALAGPSELQFAAVSSDGRFQPRFSLPIAFREVLFHPQGQLLFGLTAKGSVFVYALEASGARLLTTLPEPSVESPYQTRGRMAITPPLP
jgi:hypothetical protein